jgi:transposase
LLFEKIKYKMPTSRQETQRQTILHLWNNGVCKANEINNRTNIPLSTIYDNIKKLKTTGNLDHARGNGRKKKITAEASKALGQYIRRDSSISTRTLATKLSVNHVQVSYSTISRHMHEKGYKKSLPKATPMLTVAHKENRVQWAQQHLNDDWNKTLFTDETSFLLFRNTVERWYKDKRPVRRMPKDRTKIHAWGGFCVEGKTSLFCFKQIMDASFYVEILNNHIAEIEEMLGDEWRFQQDNDPKHTSHLAKSFLAENVPNVINWPSNSPDLNPIENLWSIVKRNVEKRMPQNCEELERFMVEEWQSIPHSVLINLVNSMRRRCELIIQNNGERISY